MITYIPEPIEEKFPDVPYIEPNITLIIDQYTSEASDSPELFTGARSMRDVFSHFKPYIEVIFVDKEKNSVNETLRFGSIEDFDVNGGEGKLVVNSSFLSSITRQINIIRNIQEVISKNATLVSILDNYAGRTELRRYLRDIAVILDDVDGSQPSNISELIALSSFEPLTKYGGFRAIIRMIPGLSNMDPKRKVKQVLYLSEDVHKTERETLREELNIWLDILSENRTDAKEFAISCKELEVSLINLLSRNIDVAIKATRQLETTYRTLDSFFANINADKAENLRLINVSLLSNEQYSSDLFRQISDFLREGYYNLDMKGSYSLMVIPGYVMHDKRDVIRWANIVSEYKVMLVTDHNRESSFADLYKNTSCYKGYDVALSHVIMTGNWIKERESELLSESERKEKAFFIPASAALAGKLYSMSPNQLVQGACGAHYGVLNNATSVELDLWEYENVQQLRDNHIVPIVCNEGKVMAFGDNTLYDGDNILLSEYPIVRMLDWIEKTLMNYCNFISKENWDSYNSPWEIKKRICSFLSKYCSNFFDYHINTPIFIPETHQILIELDVKKYGNDTSARIEIRF